MDGEIPEGFEPSHESLFRMRVEREKAGFDQCRAQVIAYVDRRIKELGDEYWTWKSFDRGLASAYEDVLRYIKGANQDAKPANPGAT
jgi:hypothetical protein